jgi:hypothetical protein
MPDFEIHFLSVKQTTFTSPSCKVLINFEVLGPKSQIDLVQVYAVNSTSPPRGLGDVVDTVEMQITESQYSSLVELQSGAFFTLHLCGRSETNGVLDDTIDGVYWETLCVAQPFVTRTVEPPPGMYPPPIITSSDPEPATITQPNSIRISWRSSMNYDKFLIWWTAGQSPLPEPQGESDQSGYSGSWTAAPTIPGVIYAFSVKGGVSALGGYLYSDWGPTVKVSATHNLTSLRQFLQRSGIDPAGQGVRSLMSSETSLRKFMKLV